MSSWSTAILDDDVAEDVTQLWLETWNATHDTLLATQHCKEAFEDVLYDIDDSCIFWLSLAYIQFQYGAVANEVKEKALAIIESGTDIVRWQENAQLLLARTHQLNNLKADLLNY